MSRLAAALCVSLVASACKVQRTPPEYIDHRDPIAVLRDAAAEELQDRLLATGQALGRGNASEALLALAPAQDAYLVASDREAVLTGDEQIAGMLGELASPEAPVLLREVLVTVGPRANVAWFRARVGPAEGPDSALFRMTGVYVRGDEGEWRLVQAHLSAVSPPPPLPPSDSLASSPASAGAPPGGG